MTGAFEKTFADIKRNKDIKDRGGFNSIPFGIRSLDKHVPGIIKGTQYIVTASSGVGKTQLTKYLFVNQPYKFIKNNPHLGIKLKIFYFALEESQTEFMATLICNRLKEVYGITISPLELRSMGSHHLSDAVYEKVILCSEYFRELERSIEVVDYISNPFGIYNYVRNYARANGKFFFKGQQVFPQDNDSVLYDSYVANDPNEWVLVITDHVSLLEPEKTDDTNTLFLAMQKWSATYCRKKITKHYGYVAVNVQQQSADKEKLQFSNSGQSIESKLEPSLDGLGDCKLTGRDAMVILGLFAPDRYEIRKHMGYDVAVMHDNYRSLNILKNRFGTPNLKIPLYFNGATNTFKELPELGSEELGRLYEGIKQGVITF